MVFGEGWDKSVCAIYRVDPPFYFWQLRELTMSLLGVLILLTVAAAAFLNTYRWIRLRLQGYTTVYILYHPCTPLEDVLTSQRQLQQESFSEVRSLSAVMF